MTKYSKLYDDIMFDDNLNGDEKVLLAYIIALNNGVQTCFATNEHFAMKFNTSVSTIKRCLKALIDNNYLISETMFKSKKKTRTIMPNYDKMPYLLNENYRFKNELLVDVNGKSKGSDLSHTKGSNLSHTIGSDLSHILYKDILNNNYKDKSIKEKNNTSIILKEKVKKIGELKNLEQLHDYCKTNNLTLVETTESVYIKEQKFKELVLNFGIHQVEAKIRALDNRQLNGTAYYKDHYRTILNWLTADKAKKIDTQIEKENENERISRYFDNEAPY